MTSQGGAWLSLRMGVGLILGGVVFILDQFTKEWAMQELVVSGVTLVPGFFDLVLVHNVGAAFGLFTNMAAEYRALFLSSVAIIAALTIVWMLRTARHWVLVVGLGMLLGGALGNLWDRLRFGWVVDFLYVHWHDWSFPVFNLADCAISAGVGLLLVDHLILSDSADA
ncbi:MAG: signal peptidase II [Magnetococcales bacterium]|nr:signal peptidase II [Magnetococcales bacterium]